MVVSIIGGSGSGKDTQAAFIAEEYGIPHISMGNIMREENRAGNPLAKEAQRIANLGEWVPDEITSELLKERLDQIGRKGFVLTGYPRPIEQIKSFDRILGELDLELTTVIHIKVPDNVLIGRMQKQRQEMEERGDKRDDVGDEIMHKRLQSYHDTIKPLLDEYTKREILMDVDGVPSPDDVKAEILKRLMKI